MKILYAVQATGNGHISRANEIVPLLEKLADTDVVLSGTQGDLPLNLFVKYRCKGISFINDNKGGIDFAETFRQFNTKRFLKETEQLPVENYDLVINDFEPVSAWACKKKGVKCLALSHQFSLKNEAVPKPSSKSLVANFILNKYAPCNEGFGFHFLPYGKNIFTPVIRKEIRNAKVLTENHYTVYLPAYGDKKLVKILSSFSEYSFHIFSKKANKQYKEKNCWIRPINNFDFLGSFTACTGIICGAGFETPAEAMFMNKKLLAIPMKNQFEQQYNAEALRQLGVPILNKFSLKKEKNIKQWLSQNHRVQINYSNDTEKVLRELLQYAAAEKTIDLRTA